MIEAGDIWWALWAEQPDITADPAVLNERDMDGAIRPAQDRNISLLVAALDGLSFTNISSSLSLFSCMLLCL
jgi:hypothetical protein